MTALFERLRTLALLKEKKTQSPSSLSRAVTSPELKFPAVEKSSKEQIKFRPMHAAQSEYATRGVKEGADSPEITLDFVSFKGEKSPLGPSLKRQISLHVIKMREESFDPVDKERRRNRPKLSSIQSVDDWAINRGSNLGNVIRAATDSSSGSSDSSEESSFFDSGGHIGITKLDTVADMTEVSQTGASGVLQEIETERLESTVLEPVFCCPCFYRSRHLDPKRSKSNLAGRTPHSPSSIGLTKRATTMNINAYMVGPTPKMPHGDDLQDKRDSNEDQKGSPLFVMDPLKEPEITLDEEILWTDNPHWVEPEDLCPVSSLGELGRGNAGGVTGVLHIPTCNVYAIKSTRYHNELETFLWLKQAMGNKQSPQLMELSGLFLDNTTNQLALVLEYMNLGSLHDYFTSCNLQCTTSQIKYIAREVLLGLRTIHGFSRPILHCDIKPNNILIASNGSVRVGDYGLFRRLSHRHEEVSEVAGTVKYFSPERHRGSYSLPSDIWALGVTLVECLIGELIDPEELTNVKVSSGTISPLDFLDREVCPPDSPLMDFLKRCLAPDPRERWDAAELLNHKFISPPFLPPRKMFRDQPRNQALLEDIITILQNFIRSRVENLPSLTTLSKRQSEDLIWDNKSRMSHEKQLENIVQWTGFTRDEVEQHVHELYIKRTGSISSMSAYRPQRKDRRKASGFSALNPSIRIGP